MRILTGFIFLVNLAVWVAAVVLGFLYSGIAGGAIMVGLVIFLAAWYLREDMAVSLADYFFQPEFDVFKKKLKWANGAGWGFVLVAIILLAAMGF